MTTLDSILAEIGAGETPWKIAARAAATTNLPLQGLAATGGVAIAEGDRVAAFGQTRAQDVGIYNASAGNWTRVADMAQSSYVKLGLTVRVLEGDNAGQWVLTSPTNGDVRVGVTPLVFGQSDGGTQARLPLVLAFNGQSNMMAGPAPTEGFSELTALLGADILGYGHTAAAMVQVVDGPANSRVNVANFGTGAGPGLGQVGLRVARLIADETGETVRTYALAYPGQSILYFLPASATRAFFQDGSQHGTLNNYNLLKSYITATGIVPEYYVFCQGEADAAMSPIVYRGHLDTLDAALQADFPGMKMVIIGTIGNRDDRQGVGQASVTGVRKAQREFAAAHPDRVLFVDNTDMRGNTAYFKDTHYYLGSGSSIGYEEVGRRVFAALKGETRPAVAAAQYPQETYGFDHWWGYRHSLNSSGVVVSWSDDIGTDSLGVENGSPDHIASDPGFGGRTCMSFDAATSDRFTEPSIVAGAGNKWVIFYAMRVPAAALAAARCIVQLEETTPSTGNRIDHMFLPGGALTIGLNGSGFTFTGAWTVEPDIEHTYLVDYDGGVGGGTAHLYVDGVLQSTRTGIGNVSVASGGNARIRVGSFSGIAHFTGVIPFLAVKAAPAAVPTADQAYALHVGARVELKLET